MRFVATTLAVSALTFSLSCARAFAVDERIADPQAMAALMLKADQALPKEAQEYYHKFLAAAGGKYPDQEWQAKHRLVALGGSH